MFDYFIRFNDERGERKAIKKLIQKVKKYGRKPPRCPNEFYITRPVLLVLINYKNLHKDWFTEEFRCEEMLFCEFYAKLSSGVTYDEIFRNDNHINFINLTREEIDDYISSDLLTLYTGTKLLHQRKDITVEELDKILIKNEDLTFTIKDIELYSREVQEFFNNSKFCTLISIVYDCQLYPNS